MKKSKRIKAARNPRGSGRLRQNISNLPVPPDRKRYRSAAWAVVLLVLAHLCWLQLQPESEFLRNLAFATRSAASRAALLQIEQLDRLVEQTGNGNVQLKLAVS